MSHTPHIRRIRPYIQHRRPDVANRWKYFPQWHPTTPWEKLMPAMDKNVKVEFKAHKMYNMFELGPSSSYKLLGQRVTKLLKYERIELNRVQAIEVRTHAEQLIIQALRYGDRHRYTMECADFYLHEKGLIHKLFKVLVPRYANYTTAFTSIFFLAPKYHIATNEKVKWQDKMEARSGPYPADTTRWTWMERAVIELKGNPLPPLRVPPPRNANILTNVLMAAARQDAYLKSMADMEQEEGEEHEEEADSQESVPHFESQVDGGSASKPAETGPTQR